ncbi:hypothetical protein F2Q70_00044004 [Brassica cretica]|uniref:Secreted protein n=1 Tax=Brassica cretica TaxID=69181 RepID=A0A8S9KIS2_BRACR|nr:hypothetical protein F2Q70_00044004 [Brassica cretica]
MVERHCLLLLSSVLLVPVRLSCARLKPSSIDDISRCIIDVCLRFLFSLPGFGSRVLRTTRRV